MRAAGGREMLDVHASDLLVHFFQCSALNLKWYRYWVVRRVGTSPSLAVWP